MKDFEVREYQEVKNSLLTTINLCAPNGVVQKKFVESLHEMELAGELRRRTITRLVGSLYDGLAYGNW